MPSGPQGSSPIGEPDRLELSSVQVRSTSKAPSRKSKESFKGIEGKKPLQTSAKQPIGKPSPSSHEGPPLHPWFEYPPSFKQSTASVFAKAKNSLGPSILLRPLPAELKFAISRNLGFVTKIFTQFFDRDGAENVKQSIGLK